jgi:hypothetical protein
MKKSFENKQNLKETNHISIGKISLKTKVVHGMCSACHRASASSFEAVIINSFIHLYIIILYTYYERNMMVMTVLRTSAIARSKIYVNSTLALTCLKFLVDETLLVASVRPLSSIFLSFKFHSPFVPLKIRSFLSKLRR